MHWSKISVMKLREEVGLRDAGQIKIIGGQRKGRKGDTVTWVMIGEWVGELGE